VTTGPPRGVRATPATAAAALAGWQASADETVIGQLTGRYHFKQVWARDTCHLWSRWQRKLVSHTLAVYLCQQTGLGSLRFADHLTT
jgi:hypothetical protein